MWTKLACLAGILLSPVWAQPVPFGGASIESSSSTAPNTFVLAYSNSSFTCSRNQDVSAPGVIQLAVPLTERNESQIQKVESGYDYGDVLGLSYLFYVAQRSGAQPANNRVPWRGNSHLDDPVVGGYYDAGDTIKVNYPLGTTLAFLAWGLIEFQTGHEAAGQLEYGRDALRWGADFLISCHTAPGTFVGAIADPTVDHAMWSRPEDDTSNRPAYVWTASMPASDLLGAVSAALAATSIVFSTVDPAYATKCLQHAVELYEMGTATEGRYSDSVPEAYVYTSSKYLDKLAWSATWLFRATGDLKYLDAAVNYYNRGSNDRAIVVNWDSLIYGVDVLLATLPGQQDGVYRERAELFVSSWAASSNGITYSPNGLAQDGGGWGTLRNTANAAALAFILAKHTSDSAKKTAYRAWGESQIDYMLGAGGRSMVVGYGVNPPVRPHHRGASCPVSGPCGWNFFNDVSPNPQVLYGALVGGPGQGDTLDDSRSNYKENEVALDYNAGFTVALAALVPVTTPTPTPVPTTPAPTPKPTSAPTPKATATPASTPARTPAPMIGTAIEYPTSCPLTIGKYGACGGISNCPPDTVCKDAQWAGTCLPNGWSCRRMSVWYWQVLQ